MKKSGSVNETEGDVKSRVKVGGSEKMRVRKGVSTDVQKTYIEELRKRTKTVRGHYLEGGTTHTVGV